MHVYRKTPGRRIGLNAVTIRTEIGSVESRNLYVDIHLGRRMNAPRPNLPSPKPPFMVRDRFRVSADLFPLGADYNGQHESAHFVADDQWDDAIAEKLGVLLNQGQRASCLHTDDPAGLAEALWRVYGLLAIDEPTLAQVHENGVDLPRLGLRLRADSAATRIEPVIEREDVTPLGERVASWLETRSGVIRLADALALSCQEDIVIMRGNADGHDVAELIQVCFPSGWDPVEKIATGFFAIHEPIADNSRLLGSSSNVMKALLTKGPYIRFSWGVTLSNLRDAHPEVVRPNLTPAEWEDPELVASRTFLRMERQTTYPMPDLGRGLFSIRIYVDPLVERLDQRPDLRPRLAHIIESTAPEVKAYKGVTKLATPLLSWLKSGLDDVEVLQPADN